MRAVEQHALICGDAQPAAMKWAVTFGVSRIKAGSFDPGLPTGSPSFPISDLE